MKVAERMTRNICVYVGRWVGEQFWAAPKRNIFNRGVGLSTKAKHGNRSVDQFKKHVRNALGRVVSCEVAKVVVSSGLERLEKPTIVITDEDEQWKAVLEKINFFDLPEMTMLQTRVLISTLIN